MKELRKIICLILILNITSLTTYSQVQVDVKVFLDGPYDVSTGKMRDDLRAMGIVPVTEPYSSSPYNYPQIPSGSGGEMVDPFMLDSAGDFAIVDWVLLELRDKTNPSNIVSTKRALLRVDGKVVSNLDIWSPVLFSNVTADDYYVCVIHRNHLGVMTANAIPLNNMTAANVDFTTTTPEYVKPNLPANAPYAPRKALGNGVMGLWAGNASYNNHVIKYNGLYNDRKEVLNAVGFPSNIIIGIYRREDLNMDGIIKYGGIFSGDTRVIYQSLGGMLGNAIYEHLP